VRARGETGPAETTKPGRGARAGLRGERDGSIQPMPLPAHARARIAMSNRESPVMCLVLLSIDVRVNASGPRRRRRRHHRRSREDLSTVPPVTRRTSIGRGRRYVAAKSPATTATGRRTRAATAMAAPRTIASEAMGEAVCRECVMSSDTGVAGVAACSGILTARARARQERPARHLNRARYCCNGYTA
jgi:hypothetical protein